jgi:hypothetical protein
MGKRIVLLLLLLFSLLPLFGQTIRRMPWGASKQEVKRLFATKVMEEEEDLITSTVRMEKSNIPCKIHYSFENSRLVGVDVLGLNTFFTIKDALTEYDLVKAELISSFGTDYDSEPDDVNEHIYRTIVWYAEVGQVVGLQLVKKKDGSFVFWISYMEQ